MGCVPLDELPFIVVDTETTGTSVWGGDRVTEVALVQVREGSVHESWSTLVYPQRPIPPWITALDARRLCTVRLARVFLRQERRSLDYLAQYYGISIVDRHRALGDAVATAHCLTRLLEDVQYLGIRTLDDLDAHIAEWRRRHRGRRRRRRSFMPTSFYPTHIA